MKNKRMKKPENTRTTTLKAPYPFVALAMAMGSGGAIEFQESRGQGDFVSSDTLPRHRDGETERALVLAGVKFLGLIEDDPLFQYVTLPKGWRKESTSHSMWSNLLDEKGRIRFAIFYKAAFYDRDARISAVPRYRVSRNYTRQDKEGVAVTQTLDWDKTVLFETTPVPLPPRGSQGYYSAGDAGDKLAMEWMNEHYPMWRDATVYWD